MNGQMKRTWAEIDLSAIEHNYREIKKVLPEGCGIVGLVKSNAYGHGAVPVASRLEALGCDMLAAACFDEAVELRQAGISAAMIVLGPGPAYLAPKSAEQGITQAVGSIEYARELSEALHGSGRTLKVHVKIDTGMCRTGFRAGDERTKTELKELLGLPGLDVRGIFTHFSVSDEPEQDEFTKQQLHLFTDTVDTLENETGFKFESRHCANSGTVINYKQMSMDMVRPGIALYGVYPGKETGGLELIPAMSLRTRISAMTEHFPGDTISYGRTFTVEKPMRIAVLPIGYGDGLHRVLSNKMQVLIHGRRANQVGRICMDMCMVDVTDIPECRTGDVATVFGRDGDEFISVDEHAEKAGTISYELLCGLTSRVERVYMHV